MVTEGSRLVCKGCGAWYDAGFTGSRPAATRGGTEAFR